MDYDWLLVKILQWWLLSYTTKTCFELVWFIWILISFLNHTFCCERWMEFLLNMKIRECRLIVLTESVGDCVSEVHVMRMRDCCESMKIVLKLQICVNEEKWFRKLERLRPFNYSLFPSSSGTNGWLLWVMRQGTRILAFRVFTSSWSLFDFSGYLCCEVGSIFNNLCSLWLRQAKSKALTFHSRYAVQFSCSFFLP